MKSNRETMSEISNKIVDEVNILHLSDLHFGFEKAKKYEYGSSDRSELFSELIKTLRDDIPEEWKPDIIVISGDIAWCGDGDEYKQYEREFLTPLLAALNLQDKPQRVITCPGNHDIIRAAISEDIKRPKRGQPLNNKIPKITLESILQTRYKHFKNYVEYCCDGEASNICRLVDNDETWPWIHFLVLNSAWDCRDNEDAGTLRVGIELAKKYRSQIKDVNESQEDIVVAIFHHPCIEVKAYNPKKKSYMPVKWLHYTECGEAIDGDSTFEDFINRTVDVVLNGHVHVEKEPITINRATHYISGTVYSGDMREYHCRIIKLRRGSNVTSYINLRRKLSDVGQPWEVSREREPIGVQYIKSRVQAEQLLNLIGKWKNNNRSPLMKLLLELAVLNNELEEFDINSLETIMTRIRRRED